MSKRVEQSLGTHVEVANLQKWNWEFNAIGNTKGWKIPKPLTGDVLGGALWLTIANANNRNDLIKHNQMFSGDLFEIASPSDLGIPCSDVKKVILRLRNLSPETDGFVRWTTVEQAKKDTDIARFSMLPYSNEWQEVICHIDMKWNGTLDQIHLTIGLLGRCGDVWIESIEIADGPMKIPSIRPDICSSEVVPHIDVPGISQEDFQTAFDVLDECMVTEVPVAGFEHPLLGPGGAYGFNWWQLDSSLNIAGSKWVNQSFVENVIRGFIGVQAMNPDGRIDLWGGSPIRGVCGDLSSVPRYFEAAYDVARRTNDQNLLKSIYQSICKYLRWWLSPVKRDSKSGLITGFSEETLGGHDPGPQTVAPMDLNIAIALGCHYASDLASRLGYKEDSIKYDEIVFELQESINNFMWNEQQGAYYSYNIKEEKQQTDLICTIFDAFRLQIVSPEKVEHLLLKLLDPELFNWGGIPLTSVAKTDPNYCEATGVYDGNAWHGDVWTMRNLPIIFGLKDIGRFELAAELAWSTIKHFNANYCEYLHPTTGEGHGVQRYGWSASQYIQSVIEFLFGIDYDHNKAIIRVMPLIPNELKGKKISIHHLKLPLGSEVRLNLDVMDSPKEGFQIELTISGLMTKEAIIEIIQPLPQTSDQPSIITDMSSGIIIPTSNSFEGLSGVYGIRTSLVNKLYINFN